MMEILFFSRFSNEVSNNDGELTINYLDAFKIKANVFHELFGLYKICLNSSVDNEFYSGGSLIVGIAQQNYGFIQLKCNGRQSNTYNTEEKLIN